MFYSIETIEARDKETLVADENINKRYIYILLKQKWWR